MMLTVGAVLAERFEVLRSKKWSWPEGVDRQTGAPVTLIPVAPHCFLDVVSLAEQARIVKELGDAHLVPPLCREPLVVPRGIDVDATEAEILAAALELVGVLRRARNLGLTVSPELAWISDEGVRIPAPSRPPMLHFTQWRGGHDTTLWGVRMWLDRRLGESAEDWLGQLDTEDPPQFMNLLATRAKAPAVDPWPAGDAVDAPMDFDRAIERGEQGFRDAGIDPSARDSTEQPRSGWTDYGPLPLAAALHHRACLRWSAGDSDAARRDVIRAVQLDSHARYLTSAALFAATDEDAATLHDRAVAALPPVAGTPDYTTVEHSDRDTVEVEVRDAARTLTARAAFRAREGNHKGARTDLEASMTRRPTPLAVRWLAHLASQAPRP